MEVYRGDTFRFNLAAGLEDGSIYEFQQGDILKIGVKETLSKSRYLLFKQINIEEPVTNIRVEFTPNEMKGCSLGDNILEVELTDTQGNVYTISQEKLTIKGDVINE